MSHRDIYRLERSFGGPLFVAIDSDGTSWSSDHKGPWISAGEPMTAAQLERTGYRLVASHALPMTETPDSGHEGRG